jgi:predicted nucleic acid-binding protein
MILVDTSVWSDHLRFGNPALEALLNRGEVCCHPFIVGEIALGYLKQRALILGRMQNLPMTVVASSAEVLDFIDRRAIVGRGIGYVDTHLLMSTLMTPKAVLWARDKNLSAAAQAFNIAAAVP